MIAYKLVTRKDRRSIFVPKESRYCLTYEKGKVVNAVKGTLGIFCFTEKKTAIRFYSYRGRAFTKILKVIGNTPSTPLKVSSRCAGDHLLDAFYSSNAFSFVPCFLANTVCFQSIKVLE